jgi:hypothetical protein
MGDWEPKDYIFLAIGVGQLIYAATTFHSDRGRVTNEAAGAKPPKRPIFIIGSLMALTWLVAGFDIYDRHNQPEDFQSSLGTYGHSPPLTFFWVIDTGKMKKYAADYKLVLVVRGDFANIDRMTDERIEKSALYTITGSPVNLAVVVSGHLRLNALQPNEVEYDVILWPTKLSIDDLKSLLDVERLGGEILGRRGQTVFGGPPNPARNVPAPPSEKRSKNRSPISC